MKNFLLVLLVCGIWFFVGRTLISRHWHPAPPAWLDGVATQAERLPTPGPRLIFDGEVVRMVSGQGAFVRGRFFAKTANVWIFEHAVNADEIFVEELEGMNPAQHFTVPMEQVGTAQFSAADPPGATLAVYHMSKGDYDAPSSVNSDSAVQDTGPVRRVPSAGDKVGQEMGMKGTALDYRAHR